MQGNLGGPLGGVDGGVDPLPELGGPDEEEVALLIGGHEDVVLVFALFDNAPGAPKTD